MSFKYIDMEGALRRLADRRIEDAMKEGKFDNLQGAGAPLDLEPMPADEAARVIWWAVRLLRQNGLSDYAVKWSKSADTMR
jgi:hypothetical protein